MAQTNLDCKVTLAQTEVTGDEVHDRECQDEEQHRVHDEAENNGDDRDQGSDQQVTQHRLGILPSGVPGGPDNPLGARALYLWQGNKDTLYRIHGTNEPDTIGRSVSSGCIRMLNQDVIDLYARTPVGAKVIVLAADGATAISATTASATRSPRPAGARQQR